MYPGFSKSDDGCRYHLLNTSKCICSAYPKLYEQLLSVDAVDLLQPFIQVFKFESGEMFKNSLPKQVLLINLESSIRSYPEETKSVLELILKKIADGLRHQKGAIFSFGPSKDCETAKNVLKFSNASEQVMATLDKHVSIHNIGEERTELNM